MRFFIIKHWNIKQIRDPLAFFEYFYSFGAVIAEPVQREDIYAHTRAGDVKITFFQYGLRIDDLAEKKSVKIPVRREVAETVPLIVRIESRFQFLIIRPRHKDIDIVIPWYESFVAHSADQSTVPEPITKIMHFTVICKCT